jgi:hypothetical protein
VSGDRNAVHPLRGSPAAAVFAFVIVAGAPRPLAQPLCRLGMFGPIEDVYDPALYLEKTTSVIAEGRGRECTILCILQRGSLRPNEA